jgi:hypothetical protein
MRSSNQLAGGRRLRGGAAGLAVSVVLTVVAACGGSAAPSVAPSLQPTPVITPDPHLSEPVTADKVFVALGAAKLGITANNANIDTGNPAILKVINAEIANWPLRITQFSSSAVLRRTVGWKPGAAPGADEAPYNIAGLNILIQYGPISTRPATAPDPARKALAEKIIDVLDPLLWPLSQHSVVLVPARTPEPTAAPSPTATAKPPAKSPKPSRKP